MIERPILIIGAPRSGTSLLFAILGSSRHLWSLYEESESVFRRYFHPSAFDWQRGNRLVAADLDGELARRIRCDFDRRAMNFQRWLPGLATRFYTDGLDAGTLVRRVLGAMTKMRRPAAVRLIEKTPKNCLRVSFLDALFPDARFVFLVRDGRANVASLFEGWRSGGRYRTYRMPQRLEIDGYDEHERWTFALPPGWQEFCRGRSLIEVCAHQYVTCNEIAMADLALLPPERVLRVRYEELVSDGETAVRNICEFADVPFSDAVATMAVKLPTVNSVTLPDPEKWRRLEREIASVMPTLRSTLERLGYAADLGPAGAADRGSAATGCIRARGGLPGPPHSS